MTDAENAAFRADWDLVNAELARLAAVEPGDDYGYERAYVRRLCLGRLGTTNAAAVLRQETLFLLAPDGVPWYRPDAPIGAWFTEHNRIHFLADQAGLTDYRMPDAYELLRAVRGRRDQRIREAGGEFTRWW